MKIAISGAQSQGKTTLVEALRKDTDFENFNFEVNLTRNLDKRGIPINENGTALTQLSVMLGHFERLSKPGNFIYDRCALDGLAYSMFFYKKIDTHIQTAIENMFMSMIGKYDCIFYIVPELPLIEDGQRSVKKDFFEKVCKNFEIVISEYRLNVIRIAGPVNTRINTIKTQFNISL
jgi:nicotinamide riboside kinase